MEKLSETSSSHFVLKKILWWGRFDPNYSRNRVLRSLFNELGVRVYDFRPRLSFSAAIEARLSRLPRVDALWVPCFRQRDCLTAYKFATARKIPVIFDPLISAWDKQVFEREKFSPSSASGKRLKAWEAKLFTGADLLIADTELHRQFFIDEFAVPKEKTAVIPVGAEEDLFYPQKIQRQPAISPPEVLFYGSFIGLQGAKTIAAAAQDIDTIQLTMLGEGPELEACQNITAGLGHVRYEPWIAYPKLASRINQADLLCGIFGSSQKAARVIPNKVYQALACGRPVITRKSSAYPAELSGSQGIHFVEPGSAGSLAKKLKEITAGGRKGLAKEGAMARQIYKRHFSMQSIKGDLEKILALIFHHSRP